MLVRGSLVCRVGRWLPGCWAAESGGRGWPDNDHASRRLRAVTSANGETRLLLDVKLENGWKTDWRAPGEGGVAPSIAWKVDMPEVSWFWPTPSRFDLSNSTTQGHHNELHFPRIVRGTLPATFRGVLT
ncbi:protein-disulfide reductase DsbD domain-containing protein, partial [Salmonella enterica]|uniref:protein-disulfide reductase DsbD domain-containing protein n=1 Tax=Salmonella enterica TaxID=28901 RepID=UPI00398C2D07